MLMACTGSKNHVTWIDLQNEVFKCLSSALPISGALVYRVTPENRAIDYISHNLPHAATREYLSSFYRYDPVHYSHFLHDSTSIVSINDHIESHRLRQSPFQEFRERWNVGDVIELFFRAEGTPIAGISLVRGQEMPGFTHENIRGLKPLHQFIEFSLSALTVNTPAQAATLLLDQDNRYAFTHAEHRIVKLICDGMVNKSIASQLNCSLPTVKTHLQNIYRKTNVNNRQALMALLLKHV